LTDLGYSDLDSAWSRIHCPQVLHLRSSTTYRSRPSKGRQDPPILGLQYREKEAQEDMIVHSGAQQTSCSAASFTSIAFERSIAHMDKCLLTDLMHHDNVTLLTLYP
jgi:hypothetical protein